MIQSEYRVKMVVAANGERFPMLIGRNGLPLFEPTIFTMIEIRARNRAANTIGSSLRAILIFYLFLDLHSIDLRGRLSEGHLLTLAEIESLVRLCRMPIEEIVLLSTQAKENLALRSTGSLEPFRRRGFTKVVKEVVPTFVATRLRYIRDYLQWLAMDRSSKFGVSSDDRASLEKSADLVVSGIDARLPTGDSRGSLDSREGLDSGAVKELLRVIDPDSPDNPWHDEHSRVRNQLMILWLFYLGLRRGELLGICVSDVDFRKGSVIVARRADNPKDPRRNQPNVKTRAREIPLSNLLQDSTNAYVLRYRSVLPAARKHEFLFVASDSGAPLSIPSFAKIFNVLRAKCPSLPRNLFAHVLRHTWNDRFSDEMDKQGVEGETEKKTRSYLMGWSETSGTSATYTRRHVRKKAQEASLRMQENMSRKGRTGE